MPNCGTKPFFLSFKLFKIPATWFVTLLVESFVLLLQNLVENGGDVRTGEHGLHDVIGVRGLQQMTGYCLTARTGTGRKSRLESLVGRVEVPRGPRSSSGFYLIRPSSGIDVVAARLEINGVDGEPSFGFFHLLGGVAERKCHHRQQGGKKRKGRRRQRERKFPLWFPFQKNPIWYFFNQVCQNSGLLVWRSQKTVLCTFNSLNPNHNPTLGNQSINQSYILVPCFVFFPNGWTWLCKAFDSELLLNLFELLVTGTALF